MINRIIPLVTTLFLLFLPVSVVAQGTETEQIGDWYYQEELDPITDEDRSIIFTPPRDSDGSFMQVGLAFGCSESGFAAMVLTDEFTMADQAGVVWRVDSERPTSERSWRVTSSRGVVTSGSVAAELAEAAAAATDRLAVRITGDLNATMVFSVDGLTAVLAKLPCYPG